MTTLLVHLIQQAKAARSRPARRAGDAEIRHLWLVTLVLSILLAATTACTSPKSRPAHREHEPRAAQAPLKPRQPAMDAEALAKSVHADLDCTACHGKGKGQQRSMIGACRRCHAEQAALHDASVHCPADPSDAKARADCHDCHGAHDIRRSSDPEATTHPARLGQVCSRCHRLKQRGLKGASAPASPDRPLIDSIHHEARVILEMTVSPSCGDCHGPLHQLQTSTAPESPTSRGRVATTCGRCHQGVAEAYLRSSHGGLLLAGMTEVPVCTDCHRPHPEIGAQPATSDPASKQLVDSERVCGGCHSRQLERYLQTYHGRALELGRGDVAACHDCHGHHEILPAENERSTLSPGQRLSTCRSCHPGAPASFASFQAHGDHTDRSNYPILYWTFVAMTGLIVATFTVWGLHTALWGIHMFIRIRRNPRAFKEQKKQMQKEQPGRLYRRFSPIDRFCHVLVIISFLVLVTTGMPLKFHQSSWAKLVFDLLGGPEVAASLHRIGAVISGTYLTIHLVRLVHAVLSRWQKLKTPDGRFRLKRLWALIFGPDSPMMNRQDARDLWAHLRYFLGRGPRPTFDRFTYWEKFDYLAELWGSAFIGLSGLVMWFPEGFSAIAPGWLINVAHVIHSQEALLAAGFILTFHFFNGHLRAEKFPLDSVMFSGRITEQEMVHERGRQYERLQQAGALEQLKVSDDWPQAKGIYTVVGLLAVYLGLALIAVIVWTSTQSLMDTM